jgi:hypothetical protein
MVFEPPRASAAMIAERSEICPDASFPVLRFAATVSSTVLTRNVAGAIRSSRASTLGRFRVALRFLPGGRACKPNMERSSGGKAPV